MLNRNVFWRIYVAGDKKTYEMIYLLTEIGLSPGDSNTVHIYPHTPTQTHTHTHTHNTQNDTKQTKRRKHKKFGRMQTVPRLCELYPDICLTTEGKTWKNLSQSS